MLAPAPGAVKQPRQGLFTQARAGYQLVGQDRFDDPIGYLFGVHKQGVLGLKHKQIQCHLSGQPRENT